MWLVDKGGECAVPRVHVIKIMWQATKPTRRVSATTQPLQANLRPPTTNMSPLSTKITCNEPQACRSLAYFQYFRTPRKAKTSSRPPHQGLGCIRLAHQPVPLDLAFSNHHRKSRRRRMERAQELKTGHRSLRLVLQIPSIKAAKHKEATGSVQGALTIVAGRSAPRVPVLDETRRPALHMLLHH